MGNNTEQGLISTENGKRSFPRYDKCLNYGKECVKGQHGGRTIQYELFFSDMKVENPKYVCTVTYLLDRYKKNSPTSDNHSQKNKSFKITLRDNVLL